jgi:hypothetical protein
MRFVGNFRKELEEFRKEVISQLTSESLPQGQHIRWLSVAKMPWKPDTKAYHYSSFIAPNGPDPYSRLWHRDGVVGNPKSFVVCGYPSPTQFLVATRGPLPEMDKYSMPTEEYDEKIKSLITSGRAKIFTGEPGDAWEIPIDAIHRSNPKATENHLVLRATYM